jgi:hypothetical protein
MKSIKLYCHLVFPLMILFLVSCQQEIEIDIPQIEPKIVIHSLITPFSLPSPTPLNAYVERSTQFSDSVKNNPELDALVGI